MLLRGKAAGSAPPNNHLPCLHGALQGDVFVSSTEGKDWISAHAVLDTVLREV